MIAAVVMVVLLALGSCALLGLAVRSRTRLRRVVLALIAGLLLLLQAVMSMFAAVGDGNKVGVTALVISVIYFSGAIASFVVMFRAPSAAE